MPKAPSELIVITALGQTLVEALERLDDPIASEAPIDELRQFCETAHAELDRRALSDCK
jgi:hypothetical protein